MQVGDIKVQKDVNSPINAERIIFPFRCLVSLLNLKLYMFTSKEPHQSEGWKTVCYAVTSTGLEDLDPGLSYII